MHFYAKPRNLHLKPWRTDKRIGPMAVDHSLISPAEPLVSVVMPAFNAQAYIEEAIESVLRQDYPRIELIVVDDGSTDGTAQRVAVSGSGVQLIAQANAGPAAARNRGLAAATGDLVAFLDADDIWLPGKIRDQVDYLQRHPEAGAVFGRFVRWEADVDGRFEPVVLAASSHAPAPGPVPMLLAQPSGWIYADLLLDSAVHIITAMVRRTVFSRVGNFDESLPTGEDYDFWLRVAGHYRIDQLDRTVACYRIHGASITKRPGADNNEYRVLRKTLEAHGTRGPDGRTVPPATLRQRLFSICFGHGYLHFWQGNPAIAQVEFARALRHAPWKPRAWAYWMMSAVRRLFPS